MLAANGGLRTVGASANNTSAVRENDGINTGKEFANQATETKATEFVRDSRAASLNQTDSGKFQA